MDKIMEKPILFSGAMVRAILDGSKTMTRRVVKYQPVSPEGAYHRPDGLWVWTICGGVGISLPFKCPYSIGETRWVRENLRWDQERGWQYEADGTDVDPSMPAHKILQTERNYIPSIHMPRCASRISLKIKEIKIERLQDISEEEAKLEGVPLEIEIKKLQIKKHEATFGYRHTCFKDAFKHLWNILNEKRGFGWDVNPWVWAISFERTK
jgi:hypothetical protein